MDKKMRFREWLEAREFMPLTKDTQDYYDDDDGYYDKWSPLTKLGTEYEKQLNQAIKASEPQLSATLDQIIAAIKQDDQLSRSEKVVLLRYAERIGQQPSEARDRPKFGYSGMPRGFHRPGNTRVIMTPQERLKDLMARYYAKEYSPEEESDLLRQMAMLKRRVSSSHR